MTVKRITLAVLTALALAPALGTPASAQYYRDDYDYRPRRPPPPDYYDDRPRRHYRGDDDFGPRRFGRICVTAASFACSGVSFCISLNLTVLVPLLPA